MRKNNDLEIKTISVKDIYENFEIPGETTSYKGREANVIKDKKGNYYLWSSTKKVYLADEKVKLMKINKNNAYLRKIVEKGNLKNMKLREELKEVGKKY